MLFSSAAPSCGQNAASSPNRSEQRGQIFTRREGIRLSDGAQTGTGPPRKPPKRAIQSDDLEGRDHEDAARDEHADRARRRRRGTSPCASTRGERLHREHDDEQRHERRERVVANERRADRRDASASMARVEPQPGTRHVEDAREAARHLRGGEQNATTPSTRRRRSATRHARLRWRDCATAASGASAVRARLRLASRTRPMRFSPAELREEPRQ